MDIPIRLTRSLPFTPTEEMSIDLPHAIGFHSTYDEDTRVADRELLLQYINLQLIANGFPAAKGHDELRFTEIASGLLVNHRQQSRLLADRPSPADARIEAFLNGHFAEVLDGKKLELPRRTLTLDRHGMARELSLPADGDEFHSDIVNSFRVRNGVLHNPKHDRRTTKGTFHVTEGGLPIADDKLAVPQKTFVELFRRAVQSTSELLDFPFTSNQDDKAVGWATLLIRPLVQPAVSGVCPQKRMEVRFFAPGNLTSNLDFVESIFGNAGDPFIPENDAGLDVVHWTGHTGCVILAPHLVTVTKKEVGLPHISEATDRQKRDGMCWESEDELYNNGTAFKLTCRTDEGVVVTIIADNYFGYCKKEVKTQIGFAANLMGGVEEEHGGGALAFPSYNLGDDFQIDSIKYNNRTFDQVIEDYREFIEPDLSGFGRDRNFPEVIYIPEDAYASLEEQRISWRRNGVKQSIPLLPGEVYIAPSGYQLRLEKHPAAPSWRIIGTPAQPVFCHKPCTVSGGGKSEISKSLRDYMLYGPIFVNDIDQDLEIIDKIVKKDYEDRWRNPLPADSPDRRPSRRLLDPKRSLGSVIKLLTPSPEYSDEYNEWLDSIPNYIYALVFIIKRFYRDGWEDDWKNHFGVDFVNGHSGHELKYRDRKLVGTYLRVGLDEKSAWRTYKLRQDFMPALKVQTEDDITASVIIPGRSLENMDELDENRSYKFSENCEFRLFQRPDDAIHRGLDKQTERDLARHDNFISNFEPLTRQEVVKMTRDVIDFDAFSQPMQDMLSTVDESGSSYVVCSANPRQIDGKPTKNPRYLQTRPDLVNPLDKYVANIGTRLRRAVPNDKPVYLPVDAVLLGRRNNPPDREAGIRSLAVYSPIHYQELPELFMDFICSLTGKSPSTTGAGSEGALTKGPFNALRPAADLNSALVDFLVTGLGGFSTSAGHVGPDYRVDHDISLLVPEIWCRLRPEERDPNYLIENDLLDRIEDFEHNGKKIPASRLGYRINTEFVRQFCGRVFDNPRQVFDEKLLRPELQNRDDFADGVLYIAEAQERVAKAYFRDGSYEEACPPLQAILSIMANGEWNGHDAHSPEVRKMFTREYLFNSDWYQARLKTFQENQIAFRQRQLDYLTQMAKGLDDRETERLQISARQKYVQEQIETASDAAYLDSLVGTIGAQPRSLLNQEL